MTKLRSFKETDIDEISSWNLSEQDLLFWANITDEQPNLRQKFHKWHLDSDISAYTLEADSQIVGYGEIWKEVDEVELARLIIRPDVRGAGFGRILLGELLMTELSFDRKIWIRVHPKNKSAINFYTRNKFQDSSVEQRAQFNQSQPIPYIWMRHTS